MLGLWGGVLAFYAAFWLWYVGIPRPLIAGEIDAHLAIVLAQIGVGALRS